MLYQVQVASQELYFWGAFEEALFDLGTRALTG